MTADLLNIINDSIKRIFRLNEFLFLEFLLLRVADDHAVPTTLDKKK